MGRIHPQTKRRPQHARVLRLRHARAEQLQRRVDALQAQIAVQRQLPAFSASSRLDTLLAVCSALLVTHDSAAILQLVVQQSEALFPGASGAMLFLSQPDGETLELRAARSGTPPAMQLAAGQAPAGRAFFAPRAMLMAGPELESALDELSDEQSAQHAAVLETWPPVSALLAPLRIEAQRLGALVIYGGTHAHLFIPRDLPFVQALADLAAVAISEANEHERGERLQSALTQTQTRHDEVQARLDTTQAQLLQSAKLAAVGELAASVAHEINNPLYAARNSLFLLEQDVAADSAGREFLAVAQSELGRIARIITRMRDFYRPTREELEPTDLNELLHATGELMQTHLRHSHIVFQAALAPNLPPIIAHADQMRQVFLNLMLNACDAMEGGGTLGAHSRLRASAGQAAIEIQISDTGVGIEPEHLAHLFEPFYTTKAQGTGLGLAISAHIITQHGGQLSVESTPGQGATFTILLPLDANG
jgi:two-component system NtrC family sensor kinase